MMPAVSYARSTDHQVSLIRKELVALTQDSQLAVVLNQLLYWSQRVKDFDLFLEEERMADPEDDFLLCYGWIYKTADELIEETLLIVTRPTMRKYLRILVEEGWMEERRNSDRKWDRTSHFRLNLKKISIELMSLGYRLPGFEKVLIDDGIPTRTLTSGKESFSDQEENLTSKLRNLTNEERNLTPKLKNLTAYTYTETTHKNTNRYYQQKPHAQENFSEFENSEKLVSEKSATAQPMIDPPVNDASRANKSIAEEMTDLWKRHVVHNLPSSKERGGIHLKEDQKGQLESLFAFHFQNDMRLWERFCLRVKVSSFLMGGGERKWTVTLDWILKEGNLLKVLEGKYDDSPRAEGRESFEQKIEQMQPNPVRDAEKAAILGSIQDPVWKEWCTKLAKGVQLNECRMLYEPLSVLELEQIANARFLEYEDERLVWIGSSDQHVLNKIEALRFKISWVMEEDFPQARTFRTRLIGSDLSPQASTTQAYLHQGGQSFHSQGVQP